MHKSLTPFCTYFRLNLYLHAMVDQANVAAEEGLKLLTVLSRPTIKAAGRLEKRLVIEEGGHNCEQVMCAL